MGWQHIRQSCVLENCDHLQLRCNRLNHHDIEAIGQPIQAMSHNRPKLNYKVNSLGATCFSALTEFRIVVLSRISRLSSHYQPHRIVFIFNFLLLWCWLLFDDLFFIFFSFSLDLYDSLFLYVSLICWAVCCGICVCSKFQRFFYLFRYTWLLWSLRTFSAHTYTKRCK